MHFNKILNLELKMELNLELNMNFNYEIRPDFYGKNLMLIKECLQKILFSLLFLANTDVSVMINIFLEWKEMQIYSFCKTWLFKYLLINQYLEKKISKNLEYLKKHSIFFISNSNKQRYFISVSFLAVFQEDKFTSAIISLNLKPLYMNKIC